MSENRRCKGPCGRYLPATEEHFYFRRSSKNGKKYPSPYCLTCEREKAAAGRRAKWADPEGREAIKAQNKAYRSKPERVEIGKRRGREYYESHSEETKERVRAYRKVPENRLRRNALWRNRYALERAERRAAFRDRYRSDPEFRLRGNIRARVWEALRAVGGSKDSSVLKVLPYSLEELKWHIESQFEEGMSWDVPGSFNIDHVVPQSMFSYSSLNDPDFRLCWSLDNLRPLYPGRNFSEGDRPHLFSGHRSFSSLSAWLRSSARGSDPEDPRSVVEALRSVRPEPGRVPMTQDGLGLLDSLFPHRFDSRAKGKPSLNSAYADDQLVLKVVAYIVRTDRLVTPRLFYRNMAFLCRAPSHFFPSAASAIVSRFAAGGRVLDPFLGWGGRALGAFCVGAASVDGCDLQAASVDGCARLSLMFPGRGSRFIQSDFREAKFSGPYDLLLTSPPFADSECYGAELPGPSSWTRTIMDPLAGLASRSVARGGTAAIHCGGRRGFPMAEMAAGSMGRHGFSLRETLGYGSGQSVLVFGR